MTITCFIHHSRTFYILPIVQLLFEGSVWSAFDGRHDIMRIGEGDHKLMSQWHYLVCIQMPPKYVATEWVNSCTTQSRVCLVYFAWHLKCFLSFISGLCAVVLEVQRDITHTGVQICSAGRTSFCLCNLSQLHSQIVIITITLAQCCYIEPW